MENIQNLVYFVFCCKHFDLIKKRSFASCSAFPNGIPLEIWRHKNDHTQPYPGGHGIQYEEDMSIDLDNVVLLDENELYGEK